MTIRIFLNIFLGISILFFPWWISLALGVSLLVLYKAYEVLFWGFLFDTIYGTPLDIFYGVQYLGTFTFFLLFLFSIVAKKKIIFYKST